MQPRDPDDLSPQQFVEVSLCWDQHHETMSADHRLPCAREELRASWKAYVAKHVSAGDAPEVPMGGAVMGDDDLGATVNHSLNVSRNTSSNLFKPLQTSYLL